MFSSLVSRMRFPRVDLLPISGYLKAAMHEFGITKLTPVQSECFAPILAGKSILAVANTGTGKTLAYLVPIVARMENERFGPFSCLIIVPTRELCQQVGSVLVSLKPALHICLAYGKPTPAFDTLIQQGPHVIVGTAARVRSLIKRGDIDLNKLKIVVVDELDSMLLDEYRKGLLFLKDTTRYQTIGVGATMNSELRKIVKKYLNPTEEIGSLSSSETIRHELVKVPKTLSLRVEVVAALLKERIFEKCIIFVKNSDEAKLASQHLNLISNAHVLHSELPAPQRDEVLNKFRSPTSSVLVCTDIAARGTDVDNVDLVISLTPPSDEVSYVHRSGRTGRAGRRGVSIVLYSSEETFVENFRKFEKVQAPSKYKIRAVAMDALIADCSAVHVGEDLKRFAEDLVEKSPELASALSSKCIETLLGSLAVSPKQSILSGLSGFRPVLFSPECSELDAIKILDSFKIQFGAIALTVSGIVVDIPLEQVTRICSNCESVSPIESLPKLVRKTTSTKTSLPWRREKNKS